MIPNIAFDFNFDYVLVLIFASYILYGYISGGHKQIRLSINLILPFIIIYYLGKYITAYMYIPLSESFIFSLINDLFGGFKYTIGMIFVYILTYFLLFTLIFIFSRYAKRYLLNENMRAKLGKNNNYIGAVFAFINGYVLIYFIILPVFALNIVGSEAVLTNFVLKNPPPFSRIARTAEKAVPVKSIADKATAFQELLGTDGIEGYYNEAIFEYQQQYIGSSNSKESEFMTRIFPYLTRESKDLIEDEYNKYMENINVEEDLTLIFSESSYLGISRVLVEETTTGNLLYKDILSIEKDFHEEVLTKQKVVEGYQDVLAGYEIEVENYEYQLLLNDYIFEVEEFNLAISNHLTSKIEAIKDGNAFSEELTISIPSFNIKEPDNYKEISTDNYPVLPEVPLDVAEAQIYLDEFEDKVDIRDDLAIISKDFNDHKGLLMFFVDYLKLDLASDVNGGNIDDAINQFKINYDEIRSNVNDKEVEDKLDLAITSIRSYDVFNSWLSCTEVNINNESISLEDLKDSQYRCTDFDINEERTYDLTSEALDLTKSVFDGDNVSWYILQYKYDYEAGAFVDEFKNFDAVQDVLLGMKELSDDYDKYYKDIANSIEGNLSMVFKIGISVTKYNIDVYDSLENTPIMSAMFNDAARMCNNLANSEINTNIKVCKKTTGDGSFAAEAFNLRYLVSEIVFKAYIMVDKDNEPITYDTVKMNEFLDKVNKSVDDNVISKEVVVMLGDQFAFNVIQEGTTITLLEQMFIDGRISIEAMRILANDEHELFSEEFRYQVKSLIR